MTPQHLSCTRFSGIWGKFCCLVHSHEQWKTPGFPHPEWTQDLSYHSREKHPYSQASSVEETSVPGPR